MLKKVFAGMLCVSAAAAVQPDAVLGEFSPETAVAAKAMPPAARKKNSPGPKNTAKERPAVARPIGGAIDVRKAVDVGVSAEVLTLALQATACAARSGEIDTPPTLTLIDYSRPSVEPRLWTFDLKTGELLFKELVAHGRNTGENLAKSFSNEMNSRQSSIGLFVTDEPYVGSNGYSLRLDGLDAGFNDRARERAIVMHGAPYVNAEIAARQGRIGRSWGCPALRADVAPKVIDRIRGGSVIFSYYPDQDWLKTSRFLRDCATAST